MEDGRTAKAGRLSPQLENLPFNPIGEIVEDGPMKVGL